MFKILWFVFGIVGKHLGNIWLCCKLDKSQSERLHLADKTCHTVLLTILQLLLLQIIENQSKKWDFSNEKNGFTFEGLSNKRNAGEFEMMFEKDPLSMVLYGKMGFGIRSSENQHTPCNQSKAMRAFRHRGRNPA